MRARYSRRHHRAQIDTAGAAIPWQAGIDFDHGTRPRRRQLFSRHEGRAISNSHHALRRGMILSNETRLLLKAMVSNPDQNLELVVAAESPAPRGR